LRQQKAYGGGDLQKLTVADDGSNRINSSLRTARRADPNKARDGEDAMGLDIVLGLVALIMAINGWRHGFWVQVMRLMCLVIGLYCAEPLAMRAEPFVAQHIRLENTGMLQRCLWWASWAVVYTLGSLVVGFAAKVSKWRKSPLQAELEPPAKFDPIFGFLFGLIKAGVAVAFIVSAVDHYAIPKIEHKEWAKKFVVESKALEYSRKYEPVPKILAAEPVKSILEIIQERGLGGESTKDVLTNLKIPKEEWDRLYALKSQGKTLLEKGKTTAETASQVLEKAKELVNEADVLKNALREGDGSKR
jgi:uncharacterized membrane protein required for colicin V production